MKKKSKKIINFLKSNWYYTLFVIPFVFFCIENRSLDNDIWFIMTNGRYVLNHGIPHVDPFSIHTGLHYVMQQWLSGVIFYSFYKWLGKYGILIITTIFFFLICFIYYKLCYFITNNKKTSVFITVLVMFLIQGYVVCRPQIFTYSIFLLELLCMEKYIKKKDWKQLIPMPILSLLLINLHASMWLLQFVFVLPVLCNCLKIKGITIDEVKLKPLLITVVLMFLVGFINPYGYESITFVFKTYGIAEINENVTEMVPSSWDIFYWQRNIILLLTIFVLIAINKKVKLDIRDILFLGGTFLFSSMHGKCIVYFPLYAGYVLAKIIPLYKNYHLVKNMKKTFDKRVFKALLNGLFVGLFFCLIFTAFFTSVELVNNYKTRTNDTMELVDYVCDNYQKEDIRLYIGFTGGGYSEFKGLKSYIDPRAEVFYDKLNRKENIMAEYVAVTDGRIDYDAFIKKYDFTHIIVKYLSDFRKYLDNNDNYVVQYRTYFDVNRELPFYILYVRKDLAQLEVADEKDS